jgi:hypothetical protein
MTQKLLKDIYKAIDTARYSPSSHNTQPWKINITDDFIYLGYDPNRHLRVGDPEKRELFMSLGCFIESLVLATGMLGYGVKYDYLGKDEDKVAKLGFDPEKKPKTDIAWSKLILNRRSNRQAYEPKLLEADAARQLSKLAEGSANFMLLTEKDDINFLAEKTYDATLAAMLNDDFRLELSTWIRNNWTKQNDGMPAYVQGIPGPVSLIAKTFIKRNKATAKSQAKKDSGRIRNSAAIGLIGISTNNPKAWIDAGRLYQRACLTALNLKVSSAGLSAAVVDTSASTSIKKRFNLNSQPVGLLRFGYSKVIPRESPRLPLTAFVTESNGS